MKIEDSDNLEVGHIDHQFDWNPSNLIGLCIDCRFWGYFKGKAIYHPEYTRRNCFVRDKDYPYKVEEMKEMLEFFPIGEARNETQDTVVMVTGPDFGCVLFEPLDIKKLNKDLIQNSNIPDTLESQISKNIHATIK